MEARDEKRLLRLQRQLAKYRLLIIDELGFVPLSKTGGELLFEVFSQRYERGSTLVTSNLPFDEWTEVFGSERLTGALLDRLTHHVHILEMNGESYRLNRSRNRQNRLPADPTPRPGLPPWVHRPLPRAPPRQPGEGHDAARAGPSRGLRGQTPSTEWPLFTPPPRSHIAPPLTQIHVRHFYSRDRKPDDLDDLRIVGEQEQHAKEAD